MSSEKRQQKIQNILRTRKKTEIKVLSEELNVSEMTIRRDLKELEKNGIIHMVFKGAELKESKARDVVDDSLNSRMIQNNLEKDLLGKHAATLVDDGDIIGIDASTTVYEMCKYIKNKQITIVTNSIQVSVFLNNVENINTILTGGLLRNGTLSLIGVETINSFKSYNTNKAFISAKALSLENELTDINSFEIETKRALIENAKEVIVLLDNTKINKTSLIKVCGLAKLSRIIVDGLREFSPEEIEMFENIKKTGVEIIIAQD